MATGGLSTEPRSHGSRSQGSSASSRCPRRRRRSRYRLQNDTCHGIVRLAREEGGAAAMEAAACLGCRSLECATLAVPNAGMLDTAGTPPSSPGSRSRSTAPVATAMEADEAEVADGAEVTGSAASADKLSTSATEERRVRWRWRCGRACSRRGTTPHPRRRHECNARSY